MGVYFRLQVFQVQTNVQKHPVRPEPAKERYKGDDAEKSSQVSYPEIHFLIDLSATAAFR